MSTELGGTLVEQTDGSLEEGLLCLLKPAVETINEKIDCVKQSQQEVASMLEKTSQALDLLAQKQAIPVDIERYTRSLANSKRRTLLLSSSITSIQERLTRLQRHITLEIAKRRNILESTPSTPSRTQDSQTENGSGIN